MFLQTVYKITSFGLIAIQFLFLSIAGYGEFFYGKVFDYSSAHLSEIESQFLNSMILLYYSSIFIGVLWIALFGVMLLNNKYDKNKFLSIVSLVVLVISAVILFIDPFGIGYWLND